ncbi:hypothetical protein ON010_g3707 [Phytophthora cinnamomi]|nr:hypothetical protein ON010_g3707 [Phytophthora cinnamomi]
MADAGSRAWTSPFYEAWSNLSSAWSQVPVPHTLRKIYMDFSLNCNPTHWPHNLDLSTPPRGNNGPRGARQTAITSGFPPMFSNTPTACPIRCSLLVDLSANLRQTPLSEYRVVRDQPCLVRLSPPPRQKQPVTTPILREIRNRCNFQTAHDRVLWGAAVVGFFFLLSRSEYLADGTKVKPYIIRVNDVHFNSAQGEPTHSIKTASAVTIKFRGSKSDQELAQHARNFGNNEAFCATGTGKVPAANRLTQTIKTAAAAAAGADPSLFGTHSMRSGGATALFAAGVDRITIKLFGRRSSDAFERYTRMNETTTSALTQQMERGARSRVSPATLERLRPAPTRSSTS